METAIYSSMNAVRGLGGLGETVFKVKQSEAAYISDVFYRVILSKAKNLLGVAGE